METKNNGNEAVGNFRVNIKQSAKGQHYFDVTVKADDEVELARRLRVTLEMAKATCALLNAGVTPQ